MPPRKKTKKSLNPEIKKYITITIFVFFGVLSILTDNTSTLGYHITETLEVSFGEYYKFIFSPVILLLSTFLIKEKNLEFNFYRLIGLFIYLISLTSFIGVFDPLYYGWFNIYTTIEILIGKGATIFTLIGLFLTSLVILFKISIFKLIESLFNIKYNINIFDTNKSTKKSDAKSKESPKEDRLDKKKRELDEMMIQLKEEQKKLAKAKQGNQLSLKDSPKKIKIEKKSKLGSIFSKNEEKTEETKIKTNPEFKDWEFPKINLLDKRTGKIQINENQIKQKELEIEEKLLQFKIEVNMEGYQVGPTVIQYRLKPKQGVKLNKIENLKKDLALALHAKSIRIQAPIPGLGVVGIEVPNPNRQAVGLREVIASKEFNSDKYDIPIAVGKDVSGDIIVGDLTKMPHLLVAGQTGSGKSVGMNGFLISMLYKFSPSELKMIMVDPKMVELSIYDGIPHLLTPVITKPDKALNALKWCVAEMLRRYDLAKKAKTRNLREYNSKVSKDKKLPYIVVVIDELADLMMSGDKKEVEGSIARIAQMARAVGMHLIIATQRPSVDVITGTIKANIPSRIAFTVASQIDSQTVITKKGAEDLLGRGDMLYYPTGSMDAERVQGVLVETHEVEAIVNKLKLTVDPNLLENLQIDEIVNGRSKTEGSILENYKGDQEEDPEVIEKAIQVVKEAKKGSTSLVQRKLGLGYARAAKVLDILEELGVVGPSNGSKPREVYVD